MKLIQRILAAALTLTLLLGMLPASAAAVTPAQTAEIAPAEKPTAVVTGEGAAIEIGDDWETKYPYGAFAFAVGEAAVAEDGGALTVPVYRMGGAAGRATVYVLFNPLRTPLDDEGIMGSGSAAGFDDLTLEAEDALPIARYQALGKAPDPEPGTAQIVSDPYTGDGAQEGDLCLSLDAAAEGWQWYVLYNGVWQSIEDGTEDHLIIGAEDPDLYDFRCVYTLGGGQYCTASLNGETYEKPAPEVLEPAPADIDLLPAQSFTEVAPARDDPNASAVFALTFADGEWVKYFRLTPKEDALAEPTEFATFTLLANEGGEILRSAGTLILSVRDNDDPEAFTIGFEKTETAADKAGGAATLTVVRTGGGQTPVTVAYSTADGTALAGRDYEAASGELLFYADYDRQTIEIPLIDDGAADDAPRSFTVILGELKGDGAGLGSLGDVTATVQLTNSGTGQRRNLATMLAVTGGETGDGYDVAVDASSSAVLARERRRAAAAAGTPVSGEQVTTGGSALMKGEFSLGGAAGGPLRTYQYGKITFTKQSGSQYWEDNAYLAGFGKKDYTGWSRGSASGDTWILRSSEKCEAELKIPHMSQYFSKFYGMGHTEAQWAGPWTQIFFGTEFLYGKFRVQNVTYTSLIGVIGDAIRYHSAVDLDTELDISDRSHNSIALILAEFDAHGSDEPAWAQLVRGRLARRTFGSDLKLTIHTANDGESGGGNVPTAPEGAARFTAESGVYESMKPTVTVVPDAGGVNGSGKLYVGSRIKVSLEDTASFFPYTGQALSAAVYLTRADGSVVNAQVEASGRDYYITLFWDDLDQSDLDDSYTINVVMTRKQSFSLDLSPSTPRRADAPAQIDPARVPEAVDLFWRSGSDSITVGFSAVTGTAPYFKNTVETKQIKKLDGKDNDPLKTLGTLENVQYINFNRSPDDVIVFNGRQYAGNDDIWLTVADTAGADLTFLYYNKDYTESESIMTAAVERVAFYWDGDRNGRIDGEYDEDTGYFIIDPDSADTLVRYMDKGERVCETFFQPLRDDEGKAYEFVAKVFYTMTPRSLVPPAGQEGAVAQMLPALTTTVTDPANYGALTEAEQSYRYLTSGQRTDGSYTADGHPMFGAAATAVQYVDVLLGGDRSPAGDDGSGNMAWTPDFHGHLLKDFAAPEPIILPHSMMGDDYPLSDYVYDPETGAVAAKDKALINGYLGSFVGNSTIALCPMAQAWTTAELPAHMDAVKPESSTLIERSIYADPGDSTISGSNEGHQPSAGFDEGDANAFPEFGMDMDTHNSGFKANLPAFLNYATFIYSDGGMKLIVAIPIASWSKSGGGSFGPDMGSYDQMMDQFYAVNTALTNKDGDALRAALENQGGEEGPEGGSLTSKNFSVSLSFAAVFSWTYNDIDNSYVLDRFGIGVLGGLSFRVQARFTPFPLAYVYFQLNADVVMTAIEDGVQTKVLSSIPIVSEDDPVSLKKGDVFEVDSSLIYADLDFKGKLYIEVCNSKSDLTPLPDGKKGYMNSDGGQKLIKLGTGQGPEFDGGKTACIRFTALEDSVITHLQTVREFKREVVFGGLSVDPRLVLEGGIGCGIDLVKVEAFLRATFTCSLRFAPYNKSTGAREALSFDQFQMVLGLGLNATALAFSYTFDAIEYVLTYNGDTGKWDQTWKSAFAPQSRQTPKGPELPRDFSGTQRLRSPNTLLSNTAEVYTTDYDAGAPFQTAGENSSAFTLSDGMAPGYDYRVVSVNGENYVLYAVGRENAGDLDRSMLVLSRLIAGGTAPGLVNPINPKDATPYIVVDRAAGNDDGSGDLEWAAWAEGGAIRAVWVSYGSAAKNLQGLGALELFRNAASGRVVKTAVFDTAKTEGFTDAQTIGGGDGDMVFLPAAAGSAAAFVEADPMDDDARAKAEAKYKALLRAAGYDPDGKDGRATVGAYRLQTQEALWDVSGGVNRLTLVRSLDAGAPDILQSELAAGRVVDNLTFARIDGAYYLAFTTGEQAYLDASGVETDDPAKIENMVTIRRLWLKRCLPDGTLGESLLLRTVYDYERNSDEWKDGVVIGGETSEAEDPGFANLHFLRARLGGAIGGSGADGEETFLLFEMNGSTYIIRQGDLENLAGGGGGTIQPFFTGAGVQGCTGVTIGADGDGNVMAAYIAGVPGTGNNALYLRPYDSAIGAWGEGIMLAMNHLDVYAESVRAGWDEDTASQAYVDAGADCFQFTGVQIARGTPSRPVWDSDYFTTSDAASSDATLLVLAQGTYDRLAKSQTGKYYPDVSADPNHTGIYAVSYGVGQQAVGEGSIRFAGTDFSAGALLHTAVHFRNTGDTGIRGDAAHPVTVRLLAEGGELSGTALAEWTITDNILPGQEVSLNGEFTLPLTLPAGTKLNLSVSASPEGNAKPFAAALQGLTTVKSVPELCFGGGGVKLTTVPDSAGSAAFNVDFTIENRGNEDAEDVRIQIGYDTGIRLSDGSVHYRVVDLTSSALTVGGETPVGLQTSRADLSRGILDIGAIRPGFGRRVTGTLKLADKYFSTLSDSASTLRIEIFSSADKDQKVDNWDLIKVGQREEYNTANNVTEAVAPHTTLFSVPKRLSIPQGMTLRLPLRYAATDPDQGHILVTEVPQTELAGANPNNSARFRTMKQCLSELYYNAASFTGGRGEGHIVITPLESGVSYLRVMDTATGDFTDIACEVTPGEGLNVFHGAAGAGVFRFFNADGTEYSDADPGLGWQFASNVDSWGIDGFTPYRRDLARGRDGASFRIDRTLAESMKLVFNGMVRVDSTLPGFAPVTLKAKGGTGRNAAEAATVVFGDNSEMAAHTVTVTVVGYAEIDWLAEYYHGDSPFTTADGHGPGFYWSSSFPESETVKEPVSLTLHAIDDRALADLWVETGDAAAAGRITRDGSDHWSLPLTVSRNGTMTLHAIDSAGNHTVTEVKVDWFGNRIAGGTPAVNVGTGWLKSSVKLLKSGASGAEEAEVRHLIVTPAEGAPEDVQIGVAYLGTDDGGALDETQIAENAENPGAYPASDNGLYLVKALISGPGSTNPNYAYRILRTDGTVEEGNGASVRSWTTQVIRLGAADDGSEIPSAPYVPYDPGETVRTTVSDDGTAAETRRSAAGAITGVKVTVSEEVLRAALASGKAMTAPVTIPAGRSGADASPVIRVEMPAVATDVPVGALPRLAIPVTGADASTVAFLRGSDGSWTPVKDCCLKDGQLILPVEGSCDLVIADNAKAFPDVSAEAWYAPYVAFVTARGIFNGTDRGFAPEGTMTRAMAAQVLYNLDRRSVSGVRADFADVSPDAWYADAVGWAAREGVIRGYGGAFSPDVPVSRQDLVTILYRYAKAAGYPIAAPADLSGFADADDVADYAREAMGWAAAIGAVSGMGDGTLAPGGTATRAQVAKIMQVFLTALR